MSTEYYNIGKRKWLGISQTNIKADTLLLGKSRSILQSPLDLKCRELRAAVSRKKNRNERYGVMLLPHAMASQTASGAL